MKDLFLFITVYLILLLAVFSVLFVTGCQENTITDPLSTEFSEMQGITNVTADKNIPRDYKDYPDVIKFRRVVNLPLSPNTYFVVEGKIEVNHQILNPVVGPVNEAYRVTVGLSIDAEMKELECGRNCGFIKENTTNTVYLARSEATTLVKYYKVKGRNDEMLLACNFEVTLDGVALQGLWITFPKVHSANNVAQ